MNDKRIWAYRLFAIGIFIMLVSAAFIVADPRVIKDTDDSVYSWIWNDADKYYTATWDNFKQAVWDMNGTGGKVYVPQCTLTADDDLVLTGLYNLEIVGAGVNKTTIQAASGATYMFSTTSDGTTVSMDNVTIRDMTIDANDIASNCMNFNTIVDCTFENLWLTGGTHTNMDINENSTRLIINNIKSTGMDTGEPLQLYGFERIHESHISNIWGFDQTWGTAGFDITRSRNNTISNVILTGCNQSGFLIKGTSTEPSLNNTITNIVVKDVAGTPTQAKAFQLDNAHYNTISNVNVKGGSFYIESTSSHNYINNILVENTATASPPHYSLVVYGSHNTIDGGELLNPADRGIAATGDNLTLENIRVIGATDDSRFTTCENLDLIGLVFEGNSDTVFIQGCNDVLIDDCRFIDNSADALDFTTGNANYRITITNCLFYTNTKGIDLDSGDYDILIKDNTFVDDDVDDDTDAGDLVIIEDNIGYNHSEFTQFIFTSTGEYYTATFANLQEALWDKGNATGWVSVPSCNLTFTNTLWIPSATELYGQGNSTVFYAQADLNLTMIKNQGYAAFSATNVVNNENDYITIRDLCIDGNMNNNPQFKSDNNYFDGMYAINFAWTNNTKFKDLYIKDIYSGIQVQGSHNVMISDIYGSNIGNNFTGCGYEVSNLGRGISYQAVRNSTISDCVFDNMFTAGLSLESHAVFNGVTHNGIENSSDITVDNIIVNECFAGIWLEGCRNSTFNNIIVRDATKLEAYVDTNTKSPYGMFIGRWAENTTVNNLHIIGCGAAESTTLTGNAGLYVRSDNISLNNIRVLNSASNGTSLRGTNQTLTNFIIDDCEWYGIWVSNLDAGLTNPMISHGTVSDTGKSGIFVTSTVGGSDLLNTRGFISHCTIMSDTGSGKNGIDNRLANMTFSYNTIQGYYDGIYDDGGGNKYIGNHIFDTGDDGIYIEGNPTQMRTFGHVIANNIIENCNSEGIITYSENSTFTGNIIINCADGIQLSGSTENNTITGNRIKGCTIGIYEQSGDWNIIVANACLGNTTPIDKLGSNTVAEHNLGTVS